MWTSGKNTIIGMLGSRELSHWIITHLRPIYALIYLWYDHKEYNGRRQNNLQEHFIYIYIYIHIEHSCGINRIYKHVSTVKTIYVLFHEQTVCARDTK